MLKRAVAIIGWAAFGVVGTVPVGAQASQSGKGARSEVNLKATQATLQGCRIETKAGIRHIGAWNKLGETAQWSLPEGTAGLYSVELNWAVQSPHGGTFVIQCGTRRLECSTQYTAGWSDYKKVVVGKLRVEPGVRTLLIRPTKLPHMYFMDLAAVRLIPVDGTGASEGGGGQAALPPGPVVPGTPAGGPDPVPGAASEDRSPIPDEAARKKLATELRELFKSEYAATGKAARAKFARSMLQESERTPEANLRLVMLVESRNLAAEGGEMGLAYEIISRIVERYDVRAAGAEWSATAQKLTVLGELRKDARNRIELGVISRAYLDLAKEAMASSEYELASDAAEKAGSISRLSRDRDRATEARELEKEIGRLEKEFKGVADAELKLSVDPEDADANLVAGRFYVFVKGDWKSGLACLAKGSDKTLKELAGKDLAAPGASKEQAEVAEAWDARSKTEDLPLIKERCLQRAVMWYLKALDGAKGLQVLRIKKRLKELKSVKPAVPQRVVKSPPGLVAGWDLAEGAGTEIKDISGNGRTGVLEKSDGTWLKDAVLGQSVLQFDGRDDRILVEGKEAWNSIDKELTLSAWVFKEAAQPRFRSVISRGVVSTGLNHFYLGFLNNELGGWIRTGGRGYRVMIPGDFILNQWAHIAMVYDGKSLRVYQDGKKINSLPVSGTLEDDTTPVTIGGDINKDNSRDAFRGRIARVRIFKRALTDAEIATLAKR